MLNCSAIHSKIAVFWNQTFGLQLNNHPLIHHDLRQDREADVMQGDMPSMPRPLHGVLPWHSVTHDIHTSQFSQVELLLLDPTGIQRCMGLQAYNDPDCNVNPPVSRPPTFCRTSNLESIKKELSFCIPHCAAPWCNDQCKAAKSAKVNGIVKEVTCKGGLG